MKRFIVTGASRGIGYQTTLALLKEGYEVIAVARSADKLEKLANEANGENIIPVKCDLTDESDLNTLIHKVKDAGNIDGLINNAGMVLNKPFIETSKQEWQEVFNINVFSVVELTQLLIPYFNEGTHIVNISSMGGFQGSLKFPGLSAYSSAKGALAILTECLSAELESSKIYVNCLCIGAVQTEMLKEAFPGYTAPVSPIQMGKFICNFVDTAHQFFNGKILPVALNNPDN